jgi:hypothetical protein
MKNEPQYDPSFLQLPQLRYEVELRYEVAKHTIGQIWAQYDLLPGYLEQMSLNSLIASSIFLSTILASQSNISTTSCVYLYDVYMNSKRTVSRIRGIRDVSYRYPKYLIFWKIRKSGDMYPKVSKGIPIFDTQIHLIHHFSEVSVHNHSPRRHNFSPSS